MNQVRDLLMGDYVRASESRLAALEARVRDLETGIGQRLTSLHQRIETMASDHSNDRQACFDELAKSVLELSDKIRVLAR
jgi:polyhydroxyalkanoate synthesis regulator phasin